jgi:hypothetical protein
MPYPFRQKRASVQIFEALSGNGFGELCWINPAWNRSIFKGRRALPFVRLCTFDRLVFLQGDVPLDINLLVFNQAGRFVRLF